MTTDLRFLSFLSIVMFIFQACQGPQKPAMLDRAVLEEAFIEFHEHSITKRRFGYDKIAPLIRNRTKAFQNEILGHSVEGRPVHALTYGEGGVKVLLWSQMHGNESTATMALFDLFNFLEGSDNDPFAELRSTIRQNLLLRFIPMVNPDGAERFQRRNIQHIDLNRDAIRQSSPEGILLREAREAFQPEFGFNLHDQNIYYNAQGTSRPATISVLAPAYNEAREINAVRSKAMKLIVGMNRVLQEEVPGHVGKYNDTFEPRAFGDNFQKWGTSTILIESGGYPDDPEKQYIRKLNFMIILNALYEIAVKRYEHFTEEDYFAIPDNDSKLMDLLIRNLSTEAAGYLYQTDIGIRRSEQYQNDTLFARGNVSDWGDLSVYYGYQELDASGMSLVHGKIWDKEMALADLTESTAWEMLQQGYMAVRIREQDKGKPYDLPLVLYSGDRARNMSPGLDNSADFYLEKAGELQYAVVNGFLIDLKNRSSTPLLQRVE
ncbi:Zinc carboxypeptidase [Cyclobacterium lianum]|uniref:Zinc carboxypeptidase n=1 Tax=Cyclobacterium lianum TaxID=388280 RepID=A0A1M7Q426_9BACT|nr:M14 metallopeptidase family protein [Cyclobacterium lianum]SHN24933.1 Zinc carboxypeptidase [Cyclobacterium lianum]